MDNSEIGIKLNGSNLREILDNGECTVCYADGREETVKLTFDFVSENYDKIKFLHCNGRFSQFIEELDEELQRVYLERLYRRLRLTDNDEYRTVCARNILTHEDCGIRELSNNGIVTVEELRVSTNGVCKLINDIDTLSITPYGFTKSGVKVLDLSACNDLLGLSFHNDRDNKEDIVLILPSSSKGYEYFQLSNCSVKGLSDIQVLPSLVAHKGGDYLYTSLSGVKGLDKLRIWRVADSYDNATRHNIRVEWTDIVSLEIDYVLQQYDIPLDLTIEGNDRLRYLSLRMLTFTGDNKFNFYNLPALEEIQISLESLYGSQTLDLSALDGLRRLSVTVEAGRDGDYITVLARKGCEIVVNGVNAKVFRYEGYMTGVKGRKS